MSRRDFLKTLSQTAAAVSVSAAAAGAAADPWAGFPETDDPEFWDKIRGLFPLAPDSAFFNTGTLGAMPRIVLDTVIGHLRLTAERIADWDYKDADWISGYQPHMEVRSGISRLINALPEEIALTENATAGMNYAALGLDLKAGDEILLTDQEHPGGISGWRLLEKRRGVVCREIAVPKPARDPEQILDLFIKAMTPRSRVLAVPHIISGSGAILPIRELCAEARRRGLFTVIDGAQSVGHIPVDVRDLDCDAYYGSLHKWILAPAGTGFLYVKKDRMPDIWTTLASTQWDNSEDPGFRLGQRGTGNLSLLFGCEAALEFHFRIGPERIHTRIRELGDMLRAGLSAVPGVRVLTPLHPAMAAGITVYAVEGWTGERIQDELWARARIRPRFQSDGISIRQSTHIYNSPEDIERTLEILQGLT
ncbi:MAG: aminotransferase class V-fold PLP-dependent enzyme [Acidobacteriota bacterium]|nr:aminotransferase class V-fold PLP-dependent enzyme [Acidobacteriota bacterium]